MTDSTGFDVLWLLARYRDALTVLRALGPRQHQFLRLVVAARERHTVLPEEREASCAALARIRPDLEALNGGAVTDPERGAPPDGPDEHHACVAIEQEPLAALEAQADAAIVQAQRVEDVLAERLRLTGKPNPRPSRR